VYWRTHAAKSAQEEACNASKQTLSKIIDFFIGSTNAPVVFCPRQMTDTCRFFSGNALFPSFPHALSGGSTRLTTGGFGAGPAIKIFAGDALNKSHTQALVKLVSPAPRALDNGRPAGRARSCCRVARPKHQYALGLRAPRDRDASSPQP
jgi:hypothetical protein